MNLWTSLHAAPFIVNTAATELLMNYAVLVASSFKKLKESRVLTLLLSDILPARRGNILRDQNCVLNQALIELFPSKVRCAESRVLT